jgi:hypothetical protein
VGGSNTAVFFGSSLCTSFVCVGGGLLDLGLNWSDLVNFLLDSGTDSEFLLFFFSLSLCDLM